jgi:hypothetical protein
MATVGEGEYGGVTGQDRSHLGHLYYSEDRLTVVCAKASSREL